MCENVSRHAIFQMINEMTIGHDNNLLALFSIIMVSLLSLQISFTHVDHRSIQCQRNFVPYQIHGAWLVVLLLWYILLFGVCRSAPAF